MPQGMDAVTCHLPTAAVPPMYNGHHIGGSPGFPCLLFTVGPVCWAMSCEVFKSLRDIDKETTGPESPVPLSPVA